ncbi:hypothetical protein AEA09_07470 [Lysinibacillus contaminans]|uniref:Uncharacterized protein n=1 Tax=Lysinibacillus contaminans TaxID=1293441 RepID=A0ABR5K0Y5_9BACI|nr:hypothetical protein [Lysinibacillus contaminans]KOS68409.1 hypothetical protein AEA09_07470 [Lysinibacillus contaminans]
MLIKYLLKLNVVSALYGFMLFVSIELQLNYYRIMRLSGWEGKQLEIVLLGVHTIGFFGASILLYRLTCKWLAKKWSSYWTLLLWLPYTVLLIKIFADIFPMMDRGDRPAPVQGLIILVQLISYPFYIGLVNFLGQQRSVEVVEDK